MDQRKENSMDNLTDKEFLAVWSLMGRARVQARQREYVQAHPIRVAVERYLVPFLMVAIGGWVMTYPLEWWTTIPTSSRIIGIGLVGTYILVTHWQDDIADVETVANAHLDACLVLSDKDFARLKRIAEHPDALLSTLSEDELPLYTHALTELHVVLQLHAVRTQMARHYEQELQEIHYQLFNIFQNNTKDHS